MSSDEKIQRSSLPIPDVQHSGLITFDAKDPDTKFPPIQRPASAEGRAQRARDPDRRRRLRRHERVRRPVQNPELRQAREGRAASTTASTRQRCARRRGRRCSPAAIIIRSTWAASCEIATSAPGYSSVLPKNKAPLALTLKLNGYSTAQFGKCHEVPVWETSPMGPFDQLADRRRRVRVLLRLHRRRDEPVVSRDLRGHDADRGRRSTPEEGYHFTEDMTNKAIDCGRASRRR